MTSQQAIVQGRRFLVLFGPINKMSEKIKGYGILCTSYGIKNLGRCNEGGYSHIAIYTIKSDADRAKYEWARLKPKVVSVKIIIK